MFLLLQRLYRCYLSVIACLCYMKLRELQACIRRCQIVSMISWNSIFRFKVIFRPFLLRRQELHPVFNDRVNKNNNLLFLSLHSLLSFVREYDYGDQCLLTKCKGGIFLPESIQQSSQIFKWKIIKQITFCRRWKLMKGCLIFWHKRQKNWQFLPDQTTSSPGPFSWRRRGAAGREE